jgi:Icc-related predicted phosphoesterase
MIIGHFSDTHGHHEKLKIEIPNIDFLIFSGDCCARRGSFDEVRDFIIWFGNQTSKHKIYVPGNHDCLLDYKWVQNQRKSNPISYHIMLEHHFALLRLIESYKINILINNYVEISSLLFYGLPQTPSFGNNWAFNADREKEMSKYLLKIPSKIDILISHGPPTGILDYVPNRIKRFPEESNNIGCNDLLNVIKKRLLSLKLHCFGHIHENFGIIKSPVSNTRKVLFSNAACVNNRNEFENNLNIIQI